MSEAMGCPKCDTTLVQVQREPFVSIGGLASVILFLIGVLVVLFSPLIGFVIIILAVIIGMARGKSTWMHCPACRKDITKLS